MASVRVYPLTYYLSTVRIQTLTSFWYIWGHIETVSTFSSGTLTSVQFRPSDSASGWPVVWATPGGRKWPMCCHTGIPCPRHKAWHLTPSQKTLMCYPLTWDVTLESTSTHFNALGQTRPENPSTLNCMPLVRKYTVPSLKPGTWCTNYP